ncbi:MAG: hypothetical protein JNM27_12350 [Leptospirales bacterium]|nr:hypothetical protein [Leptospirales bacterium]
MKFLITGALNRAAGPRLLILLALLLFALFEGITSALLILDPAPADTVLLVLEEGHVLLFFRGIEALFLASVLVGLPVRSSLRNAITIGLFLLPILSLGLWLLCVSFPTLQLAARALALVPSAVTTLTSAFVATKMYAR